jgi:hypothetical protein
MCHAALRTHYEVEDVVAPVRRNFAGRLRFHDGEAKFAPGNTLHRVGGHSPGMQVVRVKMARGFVVCSATIWMVRSDKGAVLSIQQLSQGA